MAVVFVSAFLRPLIPERTIEVPGSTIGDIVAGMEARYPGVKALLVEDDDIMPGVAVTIDDQVGQLGLFDQVAPDSEVHFLPALSGGSESVDAAPRQFGVVNRPRNRIAPVGLSRIRNTNGRSMVSSTTWGAEVSLMMTAVAAAASVPCSSTATNAL